jgi:hypothetical protein
MVLSKIANSAIVFNITSMVKRVFTGDTRI